EDSTVAAEKLFGAKSLDKAVEVQSDYVKSSYEQFIVRATKFGELYAGLAQEAYRPFEAWIAKATVKCSRAKVESKARLTPGFRRCKSVRKGRYFAIRRLVRF